MLLFLSLFIDFVISFFLYLCCCCFLCLVIPLFVYVVMYLYMLFVLCLFISFYICLSRFLVSLSIGILSVLYFFLNEFMYGDMSLFLYCCLISFVRYYLSSLVLSLFQ